MNQAASGVEEGESCGSVTANAHGSYRWGCRRRRRSCPTTDSATRQLPLKIHSSLLLSSIEAEEKRLFFLVPLVQLLLCFVNFT
ncbi:unnamed protein product [Caretta caretta]